jgi:hypothetical protein
MVNLFNNTEEKVNYQKKGRNQCDSEEISANQWEEKRYKKSFK